MGIFTLKSFTIDLNITRAINVFLLSILLTVFAYALDFPESKDIGTTVRGDQRVRIGMYSLNHHGTKYTVYSLDIDPDRWTPDAAGTDLDVFERHFADTLLQSTHKFLDLVHEQNVHEPGNPVPVMIRESFRKQSNTFGRLDWTDGGKPLHKVDDYFDHKGMVLIVAKGNSIRPEDIVGTIKFLHSPAERALSPLLGSYRGLLPPTLVEKQEDVFVEYENLARSHDKGPSPVPFLLKASTMTRFFHDLKTRYGNFKIVLNAEDDKVGFHERFSFKVMEEYYKGLKAKRMSSDFLSFLKKVNEDYIARMRKRTKSPSDPLSLSNLKPIDWESQLRPETFWQQLETISNYDIPFFNILSCRQFYTHGAR